MSSFTLNNTAADIDSAITRVVSADDTPTANSDNMVTSAGVKGAIAELASSSTLTVNSFTPAALETSTDGLTATDTAVPTSRAVKDYVDSGVTAVAGFNRWELSSASVYWNSYYANLSADSDYNYVQGNVGSVNGSTITLPAGVYLVNFSITGGTQGANGGRYRGEIHHNNITKIAYDYPYTGGLTSTGTFKGQIFVSSKASQTVRAYFRETGNGSFGIASDSYIEVTRLT